jgi:hypothetical protein
MFKCAYNTSDYPRPSIFKQPQFCFNQTATPEIVKAMSSLGPYHKYRLERALQWDKDSGIITQANTTYNCKVLTY